jgi:hypothetical protein
MPQDEVAEFLTLLKEATDEQVAEMAYLALEAMRDPAAAIDVCAGWAEQANRLFELNQALLNRMAASGPGNHDP